MKVRVSSEDLEPGMHLVGFEGPWLSHPFWRTRFMLKHSDIVLIQQSGVSAIFVDDEKGVSPKLRGREALPLEASERHFFLRKFPVERPVGKPSQSVDNEVEKARSIVAKSKRVVTQMFREARLGRAIQTQQLDPLIDEIADSLERDARAMIKVTRLKKKNEYTYLHSVAVCALMINLGRYLKIPEPVIRDVGMAGMLHDIGKMAVPDAVLDKPTSLNDLEFALIREHPKAGHDLLCNSPGVGTIALDVVLHHHERVDGTGYPVGLKGEEISLYARMAAVCDVYDAVTSHRPYKDPWSPTDALTRMLEWEGHFDPAILQAFIRSIGIYPVGTLVRLRTNRLAVVIAGNERDPTLPRVRAFYSTREDEILPFKDLTVTRGWAGDNIVALETGETYFQSTWPQLRECVLKNERIVVAAASDA